MLLIKNGRVLDPASEDRRAAGHFARRRTHPRDRSAGKLTPRPTAREIFDATGLIVAPGFIDMHCHLREPGQENSETIETGTQAAARGGFTAVCCMPNTRPVNDNASVTRSIVDRAAAVWPRARLAHRRGYRSAARAKRLSEIAAMQQARESWPCSDDGKPIATAKLLRQVMDYCRSLDLAGDRSLRRCFAVCRRSDARGNAFHASGTCPGCRRPPESIVRGARRAGGGADRCAAAHRASFGDALRSNRCAAQSSAALRVTCEVTPHHFTLIDEDVPYDSRYKMNPPLASREDRDALIEGLGRRHRGRHRHRSRAARAREQGRGVRPRALRHYRF